MKFKQNIMSVPIMVFTEIFLSLIPGFLILSLFIPMDKSDVFGAFVLLPALAMLFDILFFIISLIAACFMKTTYVLGENSITEECEDGKTEVGYDKIKSIVYDLGDMSRTSREPSRLVLWGSNQKALLSVKSPSILMVHLLRKRCPGAEISYYNEKRFLFWLIGFTVGFAILGIIIKFIN